MTPILRYTVMVVEDDPDHTLLIGLAFARRDPHAHVHVTRCAEEAIAHLLGASPGNEPESVPWPDVIVLDINMPGIGGIGFLEWYGNQRDLIRNIPVIVFTSSNNPDLAGRCLDLGAREFKEKPSDFGELVELVRGVLLQRDLQDGVEGD